MRMPLALAAAITLALGAMGPASAAADPEWQPVPDQEPFTLEACGTELVIDEVVNEVEERITEQSNGTRIETRGRLEMGFEAADGRSAVIDISGPGKITIGPDRTIVSLRGTNLLVATDEANRRVFSSVGLPPVAITYTPLVLRETGSEEGGDFALTFVRAPYRFADVCTLLR